MLQISDQVFEIVDATFGYRLAIGEGGWRSMLDLEVRACAPAARGGDPEPHLTTYAFEANMPAPEALAGVSMDIDPLGAGGDWPGVMLCIHDHQYVENARLSFGGFDGEYLQVELTGTVDFEGDDGDFRYDEPLRLAAAIRFEDVVVDEGWRDKAEARLAQFFDRARFEDPVKREDGAHAFKRKIAP